MSTNIYLVRHGQSIGNLKKIFLGHTDWDLTDLGKKQADCVTNFFDKLHIDAVYSSDLMRARDTVIGVAQSKGLELSPTPELREIYAGLWEAVKSEEIATKFPESWGIWKRGEFASLRADEGESGEELLNRIYSAIEKIAAENDGKNVVIGTHATPIRVFTNKVAGNSLNEISKTAWALNASVSHFRYENGKFTAIDLSNVSHLENLVVDFPKEF